MMDRQPVATTPAYYYHHLQQQLYSPHTPVSHHYHDPSLGHLLYRPLQSPVYSHLHHQHSAIAEQQHQQQQCQQQQQLALAAGGFQHPTLQHHQPQRPQQRQATHARRTRAQTRQHQRAMDYQTSEEELAEFQQLSNEYEPEVTGPLVGQRQPTTAITAEYASADPVFQAKTAALPQKYSHYRTVRGDGKCGWRAVAFGYFEALVRLGDNGKFLEEETRLRSLNNILTAGGFDNDTAGDFADVVFQLLREFATTNTLHEGNVEEFLLEKFNDRETQDYIITYLRMLTTAWMKTDDEWAGWVLPLTVDQYCAAQIMPVASEMDDIGLSALRKVLLSPAGIALEVLYLDRSAGSNVNEYRTEPDGYPIGSMRLLYRPGHYDLAYKSEDLPAPPPPPAVPTYLQYASQTHQEPVYDLGFSDFMTTIPGMSSIPGMSYAGGWMPSGGYGGMSDLFAPVQSQTCSPIAATPAPQPQLQAQAIYCGAGSLVPPPVQMPQELAIRSVPHATSLAPTHMHASFHSQPPGPFRASPWQYGTDLLEATSQMPYRTSQFRNSHFNQAHFLNPDFQPEQWDPEDEYATTTGSSKGSRHKLGG